MNELEFIKSLEKTFGNGVSSIGDDAALFDDKYLICKDIMAEGVHYLKSAPINMVISKLFASNISDIAAMGGKAEKVLLGMALSDKNLLGTITAAVKSECEKYDTALIGGDTSAAEETSFFSMTVIGARGKHVITRGGAKEGDLIYVSRPLGLCRLSLEKELGMADWDIDKYYHYKVSAEYELGVLLGNNGLVSAMTDISDGLGADIYNICLASGAGAVIEAGLSDLSHLQNYDIDPLSYFISSGEEYALLWTVHPEYREKLENEILMKLGRKLSPIGKITGGKGVMLRNGGKTIDISACGYEHFK